MEQANEVPSGMHGELRHRAYRTRQRMRDGSYGRYDWVTNLPPYYKRPRSERFSRRSPSSPNQLVQTEVTMVISDEEIERIRAQGDRADQEM